MAIESWSRDIALVSLPQGLENYAELQKLVEMMRQKGGCHVVIDFSEVAIVGSRIFARLLELRQLVQESGHKLILCGLSPATVRKASTGRCGLG